MTPRGSRCWRDLLIEQARLVANDVDGRVIAGSGHSLIDEAPGQVIPALLDFPGK